MSGKWGGSVGVLGGERRWQGTTARPQYCWERDKVSYVSPHSMLIFIVFFFIFKLQRDFRRINRAGAESLNLAMHRGEKTFLEKKRGRRLFSKKKRLGAERFFEKNRWRRHFLEKWGGRRLFYYNILKVKIFSFQKNRSWGQKEYTLCIIHHDV